MGFNKKWRFRDVILRPMEILPLQSQMKIILYLVGLYSAERNVFNICRNIRLAHRSVHTIPDSADRIKESAKSGTKCLFV
jgi:hypothetical protein